MLVERDISVPTPAKSLQHPRSQSVCERLPSRKAAARTAENYNFGRLAIGQTGTLRLRVLELIDPVVFEHVADK